MGLRDLVDGIIDAMNPNAWPAYDFDFRVIVGLFITGLFVVAQGRTWWGNLKQFSLDIESNFMHVRVLSEELGITRTTRTINLNTTWRLSNLNNISGRNSDVFIRYYVLPV